MSITRLRRWKRGDPLLHEEFNQLSEMVERAIGLSVDGSSGLTLTETLSGPLLGLNLPDVVGSGYTTSAATTNGNVATGGMLRACDWVQTTATTFTFTFVEADPVPFITPDPAGMPANKRVWWVRDNVSGVRTVIGALCPLTTADPTPAPLGS